MRISHNTFENGSKDSDSTNENNGLAADRVHTTSAHIPLREHVSVPMPPRIERAPLFPLLDNAEVMATELHVERQAPDADKTHQADGAAVLYERHIQAERERREQLRIEAQETSPEDTSETDEDSATDSEETTEGSESTTTSSQQAKASAVKHTPRSVNKLFEQPLAEQPAEATPIATESEPTTDHVAQPYAMPQVEINTPPTQPQPEAVATQPTAEQQPAQVYNAAGEVQWPTTDPDIPNVASQPPNQAYGRTAPTPVSPSMYQTGSVSANHPPLPPVNGPPVPPSFNSYPPPPGPGNPNLPPSPNNPYWNTYAAAPSPNYNQHQAGGPAPIAPNQPPAEYGRHKGIDTLARLGVVGNFIGNRRTRKRLGKQIEHNQQESTVNFADIQAKQLRFDQAQRQQDRDINQLQQRQTETPNSVAQPQYAAAEQAAYVPTAPVEAATAPFVQRQQQPGAPNIPLRAQHPEQPFANAPLPTPGSMPEITQPIDGTVQPIDLQPHQHLEQSAWHNIIVNERGQEVPGAMAYGEGFQRERQQEIIRDSVGGGLGVAGSYQQGSQHSSGQASQQYQNGLPSGMTTPTLPAGMPTHIDPQHQLPTKTKKSVAPGPAFWIMLALIVAAFFAAALI